MGLTVFRDKAHSEENLYQYPHQIKRSKRNPYLSQERYRLCHRRFLHHKKSSQNRRGLIRHHRHIEEQLYPQT